MPVSKEELSFWSVVISPGWIAVIAVVTFALNFQGSLGALGLLPTVIIGLIFFGLIRHFEIEAGRRRGDNFRDKATRTAYQGRFLLYSAIGTVVYFFAGAHQMFAMGLAFVTIEATSYVLIQFLNVSQHAAYISGGVTLLATAFGPAWMLLYLYLLPFCYMRLKLKAHTPVEFLAGIVVGAVAAWAAYSLVF